MQQWFSKLTCLSKKQIIKDFEMLPPPFFFFLRALFVYIVTYNICKLIEYGCYNLRNWNAKFLKTDVDIYNLVIKLRDMFSVLKLCLTHLFW